MYTKTLIAAIAGISVAGAACAGGQDPGFQAPVASQNSQVDAMNAVAQGNSVWPKHTFKLAGGKLVVGGMANIDAFWSSKTNWVGSPVWYDGNTGGSASAIYIRNANLFLGGNLGPAKARINIGYFDNDEFDGTSITGANTFTVDEAYVTFANFAKSPFYVKVGKYYQQFGDYQAYGLVPSFVTEFTKVNGTGGEIGYAGANGFSANAALFSGSGATSTSANTNRSHVANWDVNAGFGSHYNGADWGVGAGYLRDDRDLDVASGNFLGAQNAVPVRTCSSVYDLHGDLSMKSFDVSAKWARFNKSTTVNIPAAGTAFTIKPWALDLEAGFKFNTMQYGSRVGIGFQMTHKAAALLIPKRRYLVDYTVGINKNVSFMLAYYHDKNYNDAAINAAQAVAGITTTAGSNNLLAARISVSF